MVVAHSPRPPPWPRNFTMSVDIFLLINLQALFHRNTALPARLPSSGRAPRTSCVIPEPRLPKLHSCFPTDPDSIRLPSSVLTAPLGLLYSAVVPKGAFSIRDQPQPPNPLVSTLGSNWRRAQARWLNTNHQADASGQAPIVSMVLHSDVSPGVHPHILTETYLLVTNPFSTRWSPPAVLSGAVLMISGSLSALTQSLLRLVILMVSSVVQHSLV